MKFLLFFLLIKKIYKLSCSLIDLKKRKKCLFPLHLLFSQIQYSSIYCPKLTVPTIIIKERPQIVPIVINAVRLHMKGGRHHSGFMSIL